MPHTLLFSSDIKSCFISKTSNYFVMKYNKEHFFTVRLLQFLRFVLLYSYLEIISLEYKLD